MVINKKNKFRRFLMSQKKILSVFQLIEWGIWVWNGLGRVGERARSIKV